jgi:hypothetical protein
MKEQILTLERTDDLHSLRDKIARAQAGRIILDWPVLEGPIGRRLDLELMNRWAKAAGAELAVVSADRKVLRLACSAGVPCHATLEAPAPAGVSARPAGRQQFEPSRPARRPAPFPPRSGRRRAFPLPVRLGVFLAAVFSIAAVFLLLIPSATVRVIFPSRILEATTVLKPSACSDLTTRLALSDRRTTSGKVLVPIAYATGAVTLTNISNRLINLPAGIRVASENDVVFETMEGAILPVGQSRTLSVQAVEPGSSANLASGKVNRILGPLSLSLKAVNDSPTSGGAETWRNAVSAADLEALESALSEKTRREAAAGLRNLAGQSRMIAEDSLRVEFDSLDSPDLPVNSPADSVGLTMHATASATACPIAAVRFRAQEILGLLLQPGEVLLAQGQTLRLAENARTGVELTASGLAAEIPDRYAMSLALRARSPAQAETILRDRFRAEDVAAVDLRPSWIPFLPLFPYQIEIVAEAE